MSPTYQWWKDALAGNRPPIHEDQPQPGYYKVKRGQGEPWQGCAIWPSKTDGRLLAAVGRKPNVNPVDPYKIWTWAAKHPISLDDYKHFAEHGHLPGELPARDHNRPPQTLEGDINEAIEIADAWLASNVIKDRHSMDMAANLRGRLLELAKQAEDRREHEKRPHIKAGREIDAKYRPIITKAREAAEPLRAALTAYMREQEEAERAKRQAEAEKHAAEASPPEPVKVQAGGQYGRKTGLRTVVRFEVDDYRLIWPEFMQHPEVVALITKLAIARAKTGVEVPGLRRIEEKVAV